MKIIRTVYFHNKRPRYMVRAGTRAIGFGSLDDCLDGRDALEAGRNVWSDFIDEKVPDDAVVVDL